MSRWNISPKDLDKMVADGKLRGWKDVGNKPGPKPDQQKLPAAKPKGANRINDILKLLDDAGISYQTEYRFHPERRFKFDIAFPELMIAVEYEGLVATGKKGGHQTKAGYAANCTKYNLAASMGWKVYRYTSRNYKEFTIDMVLPESNR